MQVNIKGIYAVENIKLCLLFLISCIAGWRTKGIKLYLSWLYSIIRFALFKAMYKKNPIEINKA